ncbi:alpha/beta hydrolase family esterase [Nocardia nova]|uniref:alpha/beta hydrolase family esterase n=1 Tax=Nocardia nova TaxID=37330 RepID=UPI0033E086FA
MIGSASTEARRALGRVAGTTALAVAVVGALTTAVASAQPDAPAPSPGCGIAQQHPGPLGQFATAQRSGHYILDLPAATDGPTPLVMDLHGYLEPAEIERMSSGLGDFGSTHGFATITPALDEPGLPRWDFGPGSADVDYLSNLLTHVESTLCVDQRRVYVAGLSMGAFTTSSLACQLSDRIAAVAPVAGLQDFSWCRPARPVPVIAFHGTADPIVAYSGGSGPNARFLPSPDGSGSVTGEHGGPAVNGPGPQSVPATAEAWARRNGCAGPPSQRPVTPDVDLTTYSCPATGEVELYSVRDGGHTWPGSPLPMPTPLTGTTTTSIDANQLIWDFFRAHPMPRPS